MAATDGATLTHYDEVLKTFYLPGVQDYVNNATVLANILETNEEDVSGKNATIECHYGRSTGTSARGDAEALGDAGYQKYKTCTVPMKYQYGRISLTGPTLAATRNDRGAYVNALDNEVRGIIKDLSKEINRQLWGAGWGILAKWEGTNSGTEYKLGKSYLGATNAKGFGATFGAKYLDKRGDAVAVVATAGASGTFTVDADDIDVSAFSKSSTYDTITCTDPSVTEAAGTFYVRPGNLGTYAANGGHRKEMMGLRGIVTNTDLDEINLYTSSDSGGGTNDPLQGLDVSTYPWFKAIVDTHSSGRYGGQRALSLTLMQTMFDMVEEAAGKDYGPNLILTTRAIRREYLALMQATRSNVNTMTLDGGWKALEYNGVPLVVDNDAIDGEIYFLTTKDLQIYRMSDFQWMQKDGAVLSRISGYDLYEAVLFRYAELGVKNRATQGVLCDISYTKSDNEGYGG